MIKNNKYTLAALSATSILYALGASNVHADSNVGQVTAYSLNVRSGPSTSDSIIGGLSKGDKVDILSSKDGWYKIKYGSKVGWVSGDYILTESSSTTNSDSSTNSSSTGKKLVATAGLNVRAGGSTEYKIIGYIKKNHSVEMLGVASSGWYKIKLSDGTIGYSSNKYLKESNSTSGNESNNNSNNNSNDNVIESLIATANLNVRSGPSTSNSIVGMVYKGNNVSIVEHTNNNWYKVKLSSGKIGYCSTAYLKSKSDLDSITNKPDSSQDISSGSESNNNSNNNTNNSVTVIENLIATANLNVRSGPSTSNNIVGIVYKGNNVSIVEHTNNNWYKVKLSSGKIGYCSAAYLKSKSDLDSITNKPESSQDISSSMQVKAYAYYTGTITATGTKPTFGRTIAVDPTIIPYGSRVYIPEFDKTFIAEDCGGGIKGNKIDIYMNTEQECLNWGVRNITIYILK